MNDAKAHTNGKLKSGAILIVAICFASILMVEVARSEFWFEDFTDGNISDSGIDWLFIEDHSISSDGLLLSTPHTGPTSAHADWPADRQGWSIRTQAHLLQEHGFFGAATVPFPGQNTGKGTWNAIDANGDAALGSLGFGISDWMATDLRPFTEDVIVQLDTLDGVLRMWAWWDGKRPNEHIDPLIEEDFEMLEAVPGIWARSDDGSSSALFRWVAFSTEHIPVNMPVATTPLRAGDADQDLDFDQLDLVRVQIAAKYLTGQSATWGEGDWDGAPGGLPGNPPAGNGLFDQLDVIAALGAGTYLTGPYAAVEPDGEISDGQTSLVYDTSTGELKVDAPAGKELTSINITSAGSKFVGDKPTSLDGAFDNFAADNVFKATFGGSFGSLSFGNVLPAALSKADVATDLSAVGSLAGGGDLGSVDLVYVPEPATLLSLSIGLAIGIIFFRRRVSRCEQ